MTKSITQSPDLFLAGCLTGLFGALYFCGLALAFGAL